MTLFLVTATLSIAIIMISLWLASFRHAPKFHHSRQDYRELLQAVLTGQADYDQWSSVMHLPIRHDPELETLRQHCVEIEEQHYLGHPTYLGKPDGMFSQEGVKKLERVLQTLQQDVTNESNHSNK